MKNSTKALLVLGIIWLYLSNFFGYNDFARFRLPYVMECLLFAVPMLMVILRGGDTRTKMNFRKEVVFLMVLPFVSGISSMMLFHQGLYETVVACVPSLLWGAYFFLHKSSVPHDKALRFLLLFSLIGVFIMTVQQVSPERAMFGVSVSTESDQIAEVRNGLYRFRIGGAGCAGLFLFAYFDISRAKERKYVFRVIPAGIMFLRAYIYFPGCLVWCLCRTNFRTDIRLR